AAHAAQLAALLQLRRDGDGISRFTTTVEVDDGLVDGLVRRAVEVVPTKDLDDVGDGVFRQEHAAENRLLSSHILGRRPAVFGGRRLVVPIGQLRDAHQSPSQRRSIQAFYQPPSSTPRRHPERSATAPCTY